ncbi:MAG: MATE family efflux transporter, partial [Pseudomonadota bacterium]
SAPSATAPIKAALGALLFDFLSTTFNFLRMGTTGLTAQAMGSEDEEAIAVNLWRALFMALVAGVLTLTLIGPMLDAFLWAMGPSEAVAEAVRTYTAVRLWGAPFMFANYAILGWLLGLARARTGLGLQVLLGLTNAGASIILVLGFELGVAGVAAASVFAEIVAFVAGAVVVAAALRGRQRPSVSAVFERQGFVKMLAVNRDILIRSVLLIGTFSWFTAVGARFGDVTLAANALLMNLFILCAHILDGLATAAEQLGGRAVGARRRDAFLKTVRLTVVAGFVVSGALALIMLLGGWPFIVMMTTAEDVRGAALTYLPWVVATPLFGALAFVMDGLFIGATWTATMRNMMILSTGLFILTWWAAAPYLGNHGLWLALMVYLGARGATLLLAVPRLTTRTFG